MTGPADYCEELVRESDKDRFLATLFAPAEYRADLAAVYAFDLETASVAQRVRDPVAGEIRLHWWHDALSGDTLGDGHPVAQALLDTLRRRRIEVTPALTLIEARRRALYSQDNPTEAEFELFAAETAGAIFRIASAILAGPLSESGRLACVHAGIAALSEDPAAALRHREAVKALLPGIGEAALPALLPLVLRVEGRASLPQWRKQWILWRASKNLAAWL